MEIYSIYHTFVVMFATIYGIENINGRLLFTSLGIGAGVWLALFLLQGIGLYTMAKNRNMKQKWLAFIPFASVYYMGKLAGTCDVFGRKMKRPGLYVMISQIVITVLSAAVIAVEILLFTKYGTSDYRVQGENGFEWINLTGGAMAAYNFYYYSDFIIYIIQLVYLVLLFILLMGLYKKYYTRGYMLLSWVALFIPLSRYIAVFVLRNNKAVDYEAYMRAKREEFIRRQQQQNPYGYGRPPYNQGPYNQGPYNQGPYNQGPYGGNPPPNNGAPTPPPRQPDDPFAEFTPGAARHDNAGNSGGQGNNDGNADNSKPSGGSDVDDLFN